MEATCVATVRSVRTQLEGTDVFVLEVTDLRESGFHVWILMNAHKHQILVRTSVAMYLAASGACALLGLFCSGMDALVQGWSEDRSLLTAPESGQDSAHSWCQTSAGQSSLVLTEYLALPGRVVPWATPAEMVHAWMWMSVC